MTTLESFEFLDNGGSISWNALPERPVERLVEAVASELDRGCRLCAWCGVPDSGGIRLVALLASDSEHRLAVARSEPFSGGFPSLTRLHPQAHLFEREIWEQHDLAPEGHPWLKPVRRDRGSGPAVGDFFRVEGDEIHEVAVGPVHAGIIEPGHFRFQCAGEQVLHLEIALGYQHRGVEETLYGGPGRATQSLMETVAGDTTVGHSTAYATVMEALADRPATEAEDWLRGIALELERLANHTGDLGALANDVAFLPTAAACGRIRGEFLNLTAMLCGNRFGRGVVRPGGGRHGLDAGRASRLCERLDDALSEVERAVGWLWDSAGVRARFERTGEISTEVAKSIGLVGVAARASAVKRDVRRDHPTGQYRTAKMPIAVERTGDVFARARVRWHEIVHSGRVLKDWLSSPPAGDRAGEHLFPRADRLAAALVEGWRGEICHLAVTDARGVFRRYKIVDPSFHNWTGLALAMRGQAISDFPLCNKSFNLSYCGFDL